MVSPACLPGQKQNSYRAGMWIPCLLSIDNFRKKILLCVPDSLDSCTLVESPALTLYLADQHQAGAAEVCLQNVIGNV